MSTTFLNEYPPTRAVFPLEAAELHSEMQTMMSTIPPIIVVTTIVTTQEGIVFKSFIDRERENQLGGRWDQKLFPILQDNGEKMGKKQRENWFEIVGRGGGEKLPNSSRSRRSRVAGKLPSISIAQLASQSFF